MEKTRRGGFKEVVGNKEIFYRHTTEEINQKNKRCKTCRFGTVVDGCYACYYIIYTAQRRDCPGGDECTKYVKNRRRKKV